MPWIVIGTQVALPVLLLLWFACFPAAGLLAFGLQALSVASVLLAIGLAGLWSMPPFWVPYVYGVLFAVTVLWHCRKGRLSGRGLWMAPAGPTTLVVLSFGLGLVGAYMSFLAVQARSQPEVETVNIAPPFGPGTYLVAHGGSNSLLNLHLKTLDDSIERFRAWRGQSRALDIFRITPLGQHVKGWMPADPARYTTFGTPVLAPCEGRVAQAVDGVEDMQVPEMDREHMAGNYVAIDCGEFFVILAHLRQGSVGVRSGDWLAVGDRLGEMGNSGNSSEPHLHVHAQRGLPDLAPLSGEPLALTIDGQYYARNNRIRIADPD